MKLDKWVTEIVENGDILVTFLHVSMVRDSLSCLLARTINTAEVVFVVKDAAYRCGRSWFPRLEEELADPELLGLVLVTTEGVVNLLPANSDGIFETCAQSLHRVFRLQDREIDNRTCLDNRIPQKLDVMSQTVYCCVEVFEFRCVGNGSCNWGGTCCRRSGTDQWLIRDREEPWPKGDIKKGESSGKVAKISTLIDLKVW